MRFRVIAANGIRNEYNVGKKHTVIAFKKITGFTRVLSTSFHTVSTSSEDREQVRTAGAVLVITIPSI